MTPLVRWLRKVGEKWINKFYEGPEPPDRLYELVIAFSNLHPEATRGDWIRFATGHAGECYRSGYTRGYEWAEREESSDYYTTPETIADGLDPDWRWSPDITLQHDPDEVIGEEVYSDHILLEDQLRVLVQDAERKR